MARILLVNPNISDSVSDLIRAEAQRSASPGTDIEVLTAPDAAFATVKEALEKAGFKPEIAEITMKPLNENELTGDDAAKMQKLLDALDDLDDVQDVYTTASLG